jgi:hypothetical protein
MVAGRAQIEDGLPGVKGSDARLGCDRRTLLGAQAAEQDAISE